MSRILLACLFLLSAAAQPLLFFSKKFPGSRPEYFEVKLSPDGKAEYREAPDEEPLLMKMSAAETEPFFELAKKLDHFKRPVESGLPVARMGDKIFRWTDGAARGEVKFNFSQDADAEALHDLFEKVGESGQLYYLLERSVKYDRMGVNQAILRLESQWDRKRLVGVQQYIPLLERVAKNDVYLNMARERAAKLADVFRQPTAADGAK
jgi:hypothetical protein